MRNYELIKRVYDHVTTHPELHDQEIWGEQKACGTTACIAGHAVMLAGCTPKWRQTGFGLQMSGVEGYDDAVFVGDVAQQLMGLSESEAERLFYYTDESEAIDTLAEILEEDR